MTTKEMSSRVKEQYCKLTTAAQCGVGSEIGVPDVKEIAAQLVGKGVRTSFASSILVRLSKS